MASDNELSGTEFKISVRLFAASLIKIQANVKSIKESALELENALPNLVWMDERNISKGQISVSEDMLEWLTYGLRLGTPSQDEQALLNGLEQILIEQRTP